MAYNESRNDAAAKEKAIDDWLPITSSRKAKWWYSTFHNVTAMVGAGVLSLPYAMAQLGWYICLIFYHDRTIFKDDIELIWLLINRYIYVDQYMCVCRSISNTTLFCINEITGDQESPYLFCHG
jgi:hypothetical protein